MMQSVNIPCPCGTPIPIAVDLLIAGRQFSCPGCQATVSLAASSRPVAASAIEELNQLKGDAKSGNKSLDG